MEVNINGKPTSTNAATLSDLAAELNIPATGVAMAINNKMIPRDSWTTASIKENDNIVIIKAACGG